jgi:hypothetical protein
MSCLDVKLPPNFCGRNLARTGTTLRQIAFPPKRPSMGGRHERDRSGWQTKPETVIDKSPAHRVMTPLLPTGPAVIYKPARSAMTSGRRGTKRWVLQFERRRPLRIEPLMGWTGGDDPMAHVELKFGSLRSAIRYAERLGLSYSVQSQKSLRHGRLGGPEKPMRELKMRRSSEPHSPAQGSNWDEVARTSRHDQNSKSELDRRLDQALVETFPASDSIAVMIC